jgi:hypothetical protein
MEGSARFVRSRRLVAGALSPSREGGGLQCREEGVPGGQGVEGPQARCRIDQGGSGLGDATAGSLDPALQLACLRARQWVPQAWGGLFQQGVGPVDGSGEQVDLRRGELPLGAALGIGRQLCCALQQQGGGRMEGEPVVLLHGGGPGATGMSNYSRNVDVLADRFRVIVPDLPGYGQSSRDIDQTDPFGDLAFTIRGLLDELGIDSAHIVGNSYGGAAALRLALDRPTKSIGSS